MFSMINVTDVKAKSSGMYSLYQLLDDLECTEKTTCVKIQYCIALINIHVQHPSLPRAYSSV